LRDMISKVRPLNGSVVIIVFLIFPEHFRKQPTTVINIEKFYYCFQTLYLKILQVSVAIREPLINGNVEKAKM